MTGIYTYDTTQHTVNNAEHRFKIAYSSKGDGLMLLKFEHGISRFYAKLKPLYLDSSKEGYTFLNGDTIYKLAIDLLTNKCEISIKRQLT